MQTRKLYYEDCHMAAFTAQVLSCEAGQGGYRVVLDATAFYPEGGGQACDLGTLGKTRVLDVREEAETVVHLCDGPLPVGDSVTGQVDMPRRFDLMQQHTGEHIVSGIIHRRFGYHNVGFHMGADMVTIDFDGPIPAQALEEIEAEANEAVWANLPVRCWYPSREVLPTVPYRSKRALPWPVRVVEVPGYDTCACCGVHVAMTGEVGLVKLFSCVKFHQGVRIEMACGKRALDYLSRIYIQNQLVSRAFSAKPLETGAAAQRMNEALAAEKFRTTGLQRQIFRQIAESYVNFGAVVHFQPELDGGALRELATRIGEVCGGMAAVFSGTDGAYSYCLAQPGGDLRSFGKEMTQALRGRGGGKPDFQQGTLTASRQEILDFFSADSTGKG